MKTSNPSKTDIRIAAALTFHFQGSVTGGTDFIHGFDCMAEQDKVTLVKTLVTF